MTYRILKLRHDIPAYLENRLVSKWGYQFDKRVWSDFVLYKKKYISDKQQPKETIRAGVTPDNKVVVIFKKELTKYQEAQLRRRCENIVSFFPDPEKAIGPIRTRLHNAAQSLTMPERQFILEYMDENFPLVDDGK